MCLIFRGLNFESNDELGEKRCFRMETRIIERLRFLDSLHNHQQMMKFVPGDKVSFEIPNQGTQIGTLVKFNKIP